MRCPACREPLDPTWTCSQGHHFPEAGGVRRLLTEELRAKLACHEPLLADYRRRAGHQVLDRTLLPGLPHALAARDPEWHARVVDLDRVRTLLASRPRSRVLEVAPYNGWLTHHLCADGHDVTAVDVFGDDVDGLGTRAHHRRPGWRSIQMDVSDLSVLDETFDVVVVNRCLAFMTDPPARAAHALSRVRPGGVMVATGLAFFADPEPKQAAWQALDASFRRTYGAPFFWLGPTRGVLDGADKRRLERGGMRFRREWRLWRSNLRCLVQPHRPAVGTGIWG